MKRKEILDTIKCLSHSQGFYGRLYHNLRELENHFPDDYEAVMRELENQNFKEPLDLILYLEV